MTEKFDHLEKHLEKFVENIWQLGIISNNFQSSSQAGLNQKLNFIVTGLQNIDKCRQQLHDITVPLEVFEYLDQGRNPQLYTKECLERALAKHEQVKGKIDTMKKFKSLLIQELSKVFPEDMAKYRSIRGEDSPHLLTEDPGVLCELLGLSQQEGTVRILWAPPPAPRTPVPDGILPW
ncbi:mediator of RNA polymerase II transcription subunit 10-like [Thomomys bottae]